MEVSKSLQLKLCGVFFALLSLLLCIINLLLGTDYRTLLDFVVDGMSLIFLGYAVVCYILGVKKEEKLRYW